MSGLLSAFASASAQTIRGTVIDDARRPVSGVVVLLVDSAGSTVARTLTGSGGDYQLTASGAGTFRLRGLRLGFRPTTTPPLMVAAGETVRRDLELAGVPVTLDTVRVTGRNPCQSRPDSARATYAVWEQARTVLLAVQLTTEQQAATRTLTYRRSLDPRTGSIISQSLAVSNDSAAQPWTALSPDSLHRSGYAHVGLDGVATFHAPDLVVLLSDEFAQDHCFHLATGPDTQLIGVAFEPSRERSRLPEIRGTMWVDRRTAELRRVEFRYVNVAAELERADAGGALEFSPTKAGSWVIARWHIRMPIVNVERVRVPRSRARPLEATVRQVRVDGGELVLMTRAAGRATDTLFARALMTLSGQVRDAGSGQPVAGAVLVVSGTTSSAITDSSGAFRVVDILPGHYSFGVHTGALDSLGARYTVPFEFVDTTVAVRVELPPASQVAATLCPATSLAPPRDGVVSGTVRNAGDSLPAYGARVVAEWRDRPGEAGAPGRSQWLDARTDAYGRFRICGAPTDAAIVVRAEASASETGPLVAPPQSLLLGSSRRFAHLDVALDKADVARNGTLEGVILSEVDARPVPDVEVAIPALRRNAFSNERGEYRLTDLPAGLHEVVARRVGYRQVSLTVTIEAGRTVERRILIGRVVVLDTVAVRASPRDQMMREFEDNRRLGLGKFWTRAELAKLEGVPMSGILSQINGSTVIRGRRGSYAWIARSRGVISLGGSNASSISPHPDDQQRGAPRACYAAVWVDNVRVYSGRDEEPLFDLNTIHAADIEAMEYYASPAQTPARYAGLNTVCGALAIWTRRRP